MRFIACVLSLVYAISFANLILGYPSEEWLNEFNKNTADRIRDHGYPAEEHQIETEDNYVIRLFRIPYSHKLQNANEQRPVVFFMHGITSSSDGWVLNGPDDGISFLFADAGYDVWLGNARGNRYGRNNTRLSPDHPYFWQFSFHEIGKYDMATTIDYILETTGESGLHYVGHSQGTTVFFILMAERPEYNNKIKTGQMLAPCAFMSNMSNVMVRFFAQYMGEPNILSRLADTLEVLPSTMFFVDLYEQYCKPRPSLAYICRNIYFMITSGEPSPNYNTTIVQHINETHPAGASSTQLFHYLQLYASGHFRQFDLGERKNLKVYGQSTPPDYDVNRITAELYMYYSDADDTADAADVEYLMTVLPRTPNAYHVPDPTFDHNDFTMSWQVKEVINDRVIAACDAYEAANKAA